MQMRSKNVRFEKGLMWTLSLRPYKDLVLLNLVSDKHDVTVSITFRDKRAKKPELRHSESCKDGTIGPAGICPSNANILKTKTVNSNIYTNLETLSFFPICANTL